MIPPKDVPALTNSLSVLLRDNQKLLTMSLAARTRVVRHPTWEQTAAAIRDFLTTLTNLGHKSKMAKTKGMIRA